MGSSKGRKEWLYHKDVAQSSTDIDKDCATGCYQNNSIYGMDGKAFFLLGAFWQRL